jgi:two-component system chemotaxis response regulator CheB
VLNAEPAFSVVGIAEDGEEAVAKAIALRPNLITMDIRMPKLDGVSAIRAIMAAQPTPIVVLCTDLNDRTLNITFNALKAGALEVVEKPRLVSTDDLERFRKGFISTLKLMAEIKVVRLPFEESGAAELPGLAQFRQGLRLDVDAVAICSSTGGPAALEHLLRHMPYDYPVPVAVVQHITEGFLPGLVEWLNGTSSLRVKVADDGEIAQGGWVYFAPEHHHLAFGPGGRLVYSDAPAVRSHRPSGDVLFSSMAQQYGFRALGVILTGMGEDGSDGLREVASAGGIVLAQDEASSVVYGMPRAVAEQGLAREIVALEAMPERMVYWTYGGRRNLSSDGAPV